MKNIFIVVILLIAQVFTVSTAPIVGEQANCVEGEPLQGQSQPDLNITILPSREILSLRPLGIICDANVARFPPKVLPGPAPPPVKITIRIGIYTVKVCTSNTGIYQCSYTLSSFFPGLPQRISCTTSTEDKQCRFKTANITILPPPPTAGVTTISTPAGVTTTSTPGGDSTTSTQAGVTTTSTPGGDSTTSTPVATTTDQVIPPISTTTPKPRKKDDDDDSDDSDDSDSDDSDSDDDDDDSDDDSDDDDSDSDSD